jgi:hypothetical protein
MEDVKRCPRCHSDEVLPIAYGVPTPKMVEESIAGRMTLGERPVVPAYGSLLHQGARLPV